MARAAGVSPAQFEADPPRAPGYGHTQYANPPAQPAYQPPQPAYQPPQPAIQPAPPAYQPPQWAVQPAQPAYQPPQPAVQRAYQPPQPAVQPAYQPPQPAGDPAGVSIDELAQMVLEGLREVPIERETLELLQAGLPSLTQREYAPDGIIAGQTAARLGYLSRAAEFAFFDGDLGVDDGIAQTLGAELEAAEADGSSTWDAIALIAATMALGEPLGTSPMGSGPSWTLPGLGGEFRAGLCNHLVLRLKHPPDVYADDLKRTWKYGYFLRVLDELCEE